MAEDPPKPPGDRKRLPIVPEDVERGLRFAHLVDDQLRSQYSELTAMVQALAESLVARGLLAADEVEARRKAAHERELERSRKDLAPRFTMIEDKYKLDKLPDIDCDARLHLCKARCCRLTFALSIQDLDERIVRWDYGMPYRIGRRPDGYCVHNESGTCHCNIYENRPGVCRQYDCRKDKRIWEDFDARIPAPDTVDPATPR
jgi:Fe-S-cluster containining protein